MYLRRSLLFVLILGKGNNKLLRKEIGFLQISLRRSLLFV